MSNDAFFPGGINKGRVLSALQLHTYFDDQFGHLKSTLDVVPAVNIPLNVKNTSSG